MDPVSAFGLAASVINFVTFASTLISKSTEIAQSTTGLSEDFSNAETLYNRLQELSTDLDVCAGATESEDGELKKQLATVIQLARSCKADCDILLGLVAKARVGDGPRRNWRSLQAALQAPWRGAGISKLEDRLKKTQTTLTLQLCSISSYYHATHLKYLKDIKTEASRLQCNQSSKLDGIKTTLDCIQQRITAIKRDQHSSVQPFLLADIDRIEQQLAVLDIAESDIKKAHSILESLDFERRTARYSNIKPAHQETFEWIFRGHKNNGTHFEEWMKNGNRVFWVSGKPGSGKSTLMKFVAAHPRTAAELSIWSYPRPIFIASHYFWSAGNELQKSEQGLLQTLLHDIFCQRPELVETCCTERWSDDINSKTIKPWTLAELRDVLQKFVSLDALPIKFCFFIDGLDEYSGDLTDICQAVHDLSQSPNIKLCISSRPWNVFRDSFGTDPSRKLDIHDLTSDDIIRYTRFRLHQHPRWRIFASNFPNADSLIYEIAKRSQGVFLWVFLVTQRLRDGLYNDDNLLDMQNRLEELPTDLEPFFRHILEKVDPIYNEKMSGMLCIAIKANMPLHHSIYHFHSCEYDDEDYCLHMPVELLDDKRAEAQYDRIKRRLNGWCMGLLEVRKGQVDFLHRSVMDYLRTAEMSKFLKSKNKKNFDASLSLLRAWTAWIKTISFDQEIFRHGPGSYNDVPIVARTIAALEYAKDIEEEQAQENHLDQRSAKNALLDAIEATLCKIEQRDGWRLSKKSGAYFNGAQLFFREQTVNATLVDYLSTKVRPAEYFGDFERTPLSMVIHSEFWQRNTENRQVFSKACLNMIEFLLRNGEDPNAQCEIHAKSLRPMSPWTVLLSWFVPRSEFSKILRSGLFSLFLKHGADPNALIWRETSCDCMKEEDCGPDGSTDLIEESCDCKSFSSVWKELVFRSFDMLPDADIEMYIQTLDDFLSYGANSEMPSSGVFRNGGLWENQKETILEDFLKVLKIHINRKGSKGSLRVLALVTDKLLSATPEESRERASISELIDTVFPRHLARPLEKFLPKREKSADEEVNSFFPCKRKRNATATTISVSCLTASESLKRLKRNNGEREWQCYVQTSQSA